MADGTATIGVLGTGAAAVDLILLLLLLLLLEVIQEEIPPKENPPELGAGATGPDGAGRPGWTIPWLGGGGPGGNGG